MPFQNAEASILRYNQLCLHYNLVADAVYQKRQQTSYLFDEQYQPYLTAGLLAFDMGRMMGSGTHSRYDVREGGFATRLHEVLQRVSPILEPYTKVTLAEVELATHSTSLEQAYNILTQLGPQEKQFHVGATKILHFINPELYPIIDSNAARFFREKLGIPFRTTTQPGYSAKMYLLSMQKLKELILEYGLERFRQLEPGTPLLRIVDKVAFVSGGMQAVETA
ncbi:hypothetical protein [Verrucomicrobium sp. BvORR034]|uniref:hypothetical protein n=1 Tax=Verrucomicrobium sp. BvORR034 TaxID=1396418 RepID=UPI0006785E59|nr:hypothetical protein [Verrucomicrobium sp. BvORR034]